MAQRINFSNYLITFEIAWNRNVHRAFQTVIERFKNMPIELRKKSQNISSARGIVQFKVTTDLSEAKWKKIAKETETLRDDIAGTSTHFSGVSEAARLAIDSVWTNVAHRFVAANLDAITGHLADTMTAQEPILEETQTSIQAAIANIKELNEGTQPYTIVKGTIVPRPASDTQYTYSTPAGEVDASGYWAYQEFGAEGPRPVRARHFLLSANRDLYGQDKALFQAVRDYVKLRFEEYGENVRQIMGQ